MQIITPEWLFERAGLTAGAPLDWGADVSEPGPGVYVISIDVPAAHGQHVVYVGQSKHLRTRLKQFYKHIYGQKSPHRGGQEILLLPGAKTVRWAAAVDPGTAENIMIEAFRECVGVRPYGNRVKSAKMALKPG